MDANVEDIDNSAAAVAAADTKPNDSKSLENDKIVELQDDDNDNTTDTIEPLEQHGKDDTVLENNVPKTESLADAAADTSNIRNTQDVPNHGDNNNKGGDNIVIPTEGIDEKTDSQVTNAQDVLHGDNNNLEVETVKVKDQGIESDDVQELAKADTNSEVSEIEQPADTRIEDDEGIVKKEEDNTVILNADTNSEVSAINDEPVATEKSFEIDTQQSVSSPISLPPPPIRVEMVQAKTEDGGIIKVPKYEKDMKVQYKSSSGVQGCTILDVHLDDLLVPYYTVRLDDGKEKQTDNAHIVLDENVNTEDEVSQQPPVDDEAKEHLDRQIQFVATQENEEKASNDLLDREILFNDSSIINIQAFNAASDKTLSFTTPVLRVSAGRYFWSADVYEKRILAIYKNPDVILVMRLPKDREEVQRLGGNLKAKELSSFLVAENVSSPMACKIRLSQLTNETSVPTKKSTEQGLRSSMNEIVAKQNDINRKRSCFDLLTPTETVTLSAAFLPPDCFDDIEYTSEKSLNDTHRCEDAIISALVNSHLSDGGVSLDDTWKHQVILGTLHSYVISGNEHTLKESLSSALAIQQSQSGSGSGINKIDPSIIDLKDDSGKTALHYACSRQKNSTVQTLVSFGADCSTSQDDGGMTPSHICAKGLDDKILSIILSATYPVRPNPNALDSQGRTPMYLAAVEGGGSGDSKSNAMALDRCLSALDAWGGQFLIESPKSKDLFHPIHCVSANWKAEDLSVILSHCNYRYPLTSGSSLSAMFQYPIHAALISLRRHIHAVFQTNEDGSMNAEFIPLLPSLVKTVRTLLDHGFEPNERFEGIVGQGDKFKGLSCFVGFSPLQVLALAALDARAIQLTKQELEENDALTLGILRNIMKAIQQLAELLCKNGARINLPPPPPTRLDRPTPTGCYSLKEALDDPETSTLQMGNREELKLDGKDNEIINLLGGINRVNAAQKAFVIKSTSNTDKSIKIETASIDSDAPGGSDSNSCAICWSEFGIISNRKHLCRVSQRYVCNDCSMKRLVVNGSEQRVSDGQYLLSISEALKAAARIQANRQEQMKKQRQSVSQARASLGLKSTDGSGNSGDNSSKTELSTQDRISNALSGLGQMKDKVLERGDKLNSLQEKSEALEQASLDFANMAKELNRSQNSWFG